MSENPDHFPAVSAHLSRVLDEIGMNTLTVYRKRHSCLFREEMLNLYRNIQHKVSILFNNFGSQSEGTITSGLKSDYDALNCDTYTNAIQDWSEWQQGRMNLLMLQEDTAPGYCRLQLLRRDVPMAAEHLPDHYYTYDRKNGVIVKNTSLISQVPGIIQTTRNGPAHTYQENISGDHCDFVDAFRCNTWPVQADRWTTKHRPRNWPTQSLIQKVIRRGVFLVPVGYKLSETENLEWRISFSLTERLLMFSLNIIQLKCYVVLKMIMKSLIIPFVGESISSYHCKTVLFHCIEDTGVEFWTENNLLQGINMCLSLLVTCVRNQVCPHFILPDSNLFAGKINSRNRGKILSVIRDMIESNGRFLLQIPTDQLGQKLKMKLGSSPVLIPILESIETMWIVCDEEVARMCVYENINVRLLLKQMNNTPMEAVQQIQCNINALCGRHEHSKKHNRQALRAFIEMLRYQLGSLLAAISLSRQKELSREVLKWFLVCGRHDISSQMKLATVYFCNCSFEKAELILQNVEVILERNAIQTMCGCFPHDYITTLKFCWQMVVIESEKTRSRMFAHCIMFSPQEIHCTPPALRYEMYRSTGDDRQHRHPFFDKYMDLAVVEPLPYLYYLQYLTYDKLGKCDLKTQALHNLERCVRKSTNSCHLDTAWNLLGKCMEQEKKPEAAMACYRTSLEVRPRNNAANWHIQKLTSNVSV